MAKITIDILRSKIYSIAEGISVSISQHNGGTPSYEQLWASEDEAPKLDIYYREAVGDLERNLMRWVKEASAQFDLTKSGTDYQLSLDMNRYWPLKLQGLLANKIQDYLVHAVTAGWLNDFEGLSIKQDYQAIATTDISDIHHIICQRSFGFREGMRSEDDSIKSENQREGRLMRHHDNTADDFRRECATARKHDATTAKDAKDTCVTERRADDSKTDARDTSVNERRADDSKTMPGLRREVSHRREDDEKGDMRKGQEARLRHRDNTMERRNKEAATERRTDDTKDAVKHKPMATHRHGDCQAKGKSAASRAQNRHNDTNKTENRKTLFANDQRHRDNAIVEHHQEYTDWSGADTMPKPRHYDRHAPLIQKGAVIGQQSPRVANGMGCHPGRQRPPQPQKQEEKTYMTSGGMISALQLNKSLLAKENVGKIYNVTEGFFPTEDFIEGVSGKRLQPGTNVQVVDVGTPENPKYMFDTFEAPKEEDVFIDIDEGVVDNWFN